MKIGDFFEKIDTQMKLFGTVPSTLCTLYPMTGSVIEIRQCLGDKEEERTQPSRQQTQSAKESAEQSRAEEMPLLT